MGSCLLFGNGINRCFGANSWDVLLHNIAERYFVSTDYINYSLLAFEQIMCSAIRNRIRNTTNSFALDEINRLDNVDSSSIYQLFLRGANKTILTTNFDYAIERSINPNFEYGKKSKLFSTKNAQETHVSCGRYTEIQGNKIFHVHGELGLKNTICLGQIHYAVNITRIIEKINRIGDSEDNIPELVNEIFTSNIIISWAQYFFTHDVHIVGLSLTPSEMDLWWLIAYRAQLIYRQDSRINNKVFFYYLYENKKDNQLINCLKDLKIEVPEHKVYGSDWKAAYESIANTIGEN